MGSPDVARGEPTDLRPRHKKMLGGRRSDPQRCSLPTTAGKPYSRTITAPRSPAGLPTQRTTSTGKDGRTGAPRSGGRARAGHRLPRALRCGRSSAPPSLGEVRDRQEDAIRSRTCPCRRAQEVRYETPGCDMGHSETTASSAPQPMARRRPQATATEARDPDEASLPPRRSDGAVPHPGSTSWTEYRKPAS
jgi:hypothetical protein